METHTKPSEHIYACQNCATRFTAPVYKDDPMVLIEDGGEYTWVSRVSRTRYYPAEKCCDLPFIEELKQYPRKR